MKWALSCWDDTLVVESWWLQQSQPHTKCFSSMGPLFNLNNKLTEVTWDRINIRGGVNNELLPRYVGFRIRVLCFSQEVAPVESAPKPAPVEAPQSAPAPPKPAAPAPAAYKVCLKWLVWHFFSACFGIIFMSNSPPFYSSCLIFQAFHSFWYSGFHFRLAILASLSCLR